MPEEGIVFVSDVGGVKLVRLRAGNLTREADVEVFGMALEALAEEPDQKVVLSFLGVEHLASLAIGRLVRVQRLMEAGGSEMVLADIDPRIFEVFALTALDKMFHVFEREGDALAYFKGKAEA